MKPFEFLPIIFEKKKIPSDEDIEKYCSQYLLNLNLSCDRQFVGIAHEISKYKISNRMWFDCLYYAIPKGKRYIPYTATKAKKDQEVLYLMEYFGCSQQTAKEYSFLIDEDEMKEIKNYFEKRGLK